MKGLSRNTLKHIKSAISGIFTLAKQQDYFQGENPARDSAINPEAAEPKETYAYSLDEIHTILWCASRTGGDSIRCSGIHGPAAW